MALAMFARLQKIAISFETAISLKNCAKNHALTLSENSARVRFGSFRLPCKNTKTAKPTGATAEKSSVPW